MKTHKLTEAQVKAIVMIGDTSGTRRYSVGKWLALPPVNSRTLAVLEREEYVEFRERDSMYRLTLKGVKAYEAAQDDSAAQVAPEFLASLAESGIKAVIIPTHHVTSTPRQMTNGDTAYTAECEHGWTTGFHNTAEDAEAVALGHGDVSRPLYKAPANLWAPGTYVVSDWRAPRIVEVAEAPAEPFRAAKGKAKISRRSRNRW